jgi:hypothetical protein
LKPGQLALRVLSWYLWLGLLISWNKDGDIKKVHVVATLLETMIDLHNQAFAVFLSALSGQESGTGGRLKDFAYTLVGLGRTLEVFVGTDLLTNFLALL